MTYLLETLGRWCGTVHADWTPACMGRFEGETSLQASTFALREHAEQMMVKFQHIMATSHPILLRVEATPAIFRVREVP